MLVVLINPSDEAVYRAAARQPIRRPPLGLAYLAGALEAGGHRAEIMDLALDPGFTETAVERLAGLAPGLIAVTSTTPVFPSAAALIARIKEVLPRTPVVLGGPHASALPRRSLLESGADCVFVGDGEPGIVELADSLNRGLRLANGIIEGERVERLDSIPPPALNRLDLQRYRDEIDGDLRTCASMITGRGCIGRCRFCQGESQRIRQHSVPRVLSDLEEVYGRHGIRTVFFADDVFSYPKRRLAALSEGMRSRFPDLVYSCHVRLDTITAEIIDLLQASGCRLVRPGIESGSDRILRAMGKRITTDTIRKKVKLLKEKGLPFRASYMLGWPGETEAEMLRTIEFAREVDAERTSFAAVTPLPGTPLWQDLLRAYPGREAWDWSAFRFYGKPQFNLSAVDSDTLAGCLALAADGGAAGNGKGAPA